MQIATFDFHNTIATCDRWFELEIRDLPAEVLRNMGQLNGSSAGEELARRTTAAYRELRAHIMDTGIERDAQASVEHVFERVGVQASPEEIAAAIEDLMRDATSTLTPVPGAVETISAMLDAHIPIGIISSAVYHPYLEWALSEFGLLDRLAFVATSASVGYYKSDIRIYHHAYHSVNATPELGVHVGDSPRWDVLVAREAGLGTVLYLDDTRQVGSTARADVTPDLVLTSLVGAEKPIMDLLDQRRTTRSSA